MTKVTDHFKTKVHLESTEVDVIIRSRLLHKTEAGHKQLLGYHKKNEGLVSDATLTTYYDIKPVIEETLALLLEAKVLLLSNHNYKITFNLEGKLLEEMKDFDVELFSKKRSLTNCIKDYKLFIPIATYIDGTDSFKFSLLSDQDDELTSPGSKQLKLTVYSLFNISEDRQDFIDNLKLEPQSQKGLITPVPENTEFSLIDKLIGEVSRYSYMEEKYSNASDPAKRQIIRDFSIIREEKEKELRVKIEKAYHNASLIYMFDEHLLNADSFKGTISEIQRKLIKSIYTKRLASGLSESLVPIRCAGAPCRAHRCCRRDPRAGSHRRPCGPGRRIHSGSRTRRG